MTTGRPGAPAPARERPPVAGAERFEARARRDRRRRLQRRLTVLAALLAVAAVLWVVLASPLLGVRAVQVAGTGRTSAEEVRVAAALAPGTPLARLDPAGLRARVLAALPAVETVTVQRRWPGTVRVTVVERVAVAATAGEGGFNLLDAAGVRFATEAAAPEGLPVLTLPSGLDPAASEATTGAALTVLDALTPEVRALVTDVTVSSRAEVRLTLDADRSVVWGPATGSARKAAALAALVDGTATEFDVSAPGLVTTR